MTEFDIDLGYNSKMGKMEKPSEVRLKKDKIEDAEKMNLRYGKHPLGDEKLKKFWSRDLTKAEILR